LNDSWELVVLIAERTVNLEFSDRAVLQTFSGLSLKNRVVHWAEVISTGTTLVITLFIRVITILLGVYTQTLGYEFYIDTIDMLN
jgi:hypothetical protein